MDVVSFILGFVKGKSSNSFTDEELSQGLDYINGEQVYTVKYYDGDTLLKTEYRARGSVPTYAGPADKTDQIFVGWDHAFVTIYGDQEYHAVWEEKMSFATASWADISRVSNAGRASRHFNIGDTKNVEISYTGGTKGTLQVAIAGFDHDILSDDSNGLAGISIVCMNVPNFARRWSAYTANVANYSHYYDQSYMSTVLLSECFNKMPAELTSVIKTVRKTIDAQTMYSGTGTVGTMDVDANLWLISLTEMGVQMPVLSADSSTSQEIHTLGIPYPLFEEAGAQGVFDPVYIEGKTTAVDYWTRQLAPVGRNTYCPCYIESASSVPKYTDNVIQTKYIRFGFCV